MKVALRSSVPLYWAVLVLCVAGIVVVSVAVFFVKVFYVDQAVFIDNAVVQDLPGATAEFPVRLEIPKIGVDAAIEYVGLTPQGIMDVPAGPADVAWFDPGPRPGEKGSAVIAGHEGWKDGIAAAFDDLDKLHAGDKIYVRDGRGAIIAFVVSKTREYDQNGDASGVFASNDGRAHLNLITCEGTWNAAQKSYSNRLVVFADKE